MKEPHQSPNLASSLRHALAGIAYVLRSQRNARLHALVTLIALAVSLWLELSTTEWALIALSIGLVWFSESFNTALEQTVNLIQPEVHPLARAGKDAAAAAVLISVLTSVVIGFLVWGPKLFAKLFGG